MYLRFLLGMLIWLPITAHATPDGNIAQPLVYSLTTLIIDKKSVSNAANATNADQPPVNTAQQLVLDAEIKDALNFYRQDGWINLTAMKENHAVLLVFENLSQDPIVPASNYAPIDILMIDEQGKITEIAPSLALANLDQEIFPRNPVKAFLLLAGGSTTRLGINPGDEVVYSVFKKPPSVLSESSPVPVANPEMPAGAVTKIQGENAMPPKPSLTERRKPELQPNKSKPQ